MGKHIEKKAQLGKWLFTAIMVLVTLIVLFVIISGQAKNIISNIASLA